MRILCIVLLASTLVPCAAQETGVAPAPRKLLTFTLHDVPLRKALARWAELTGAQVSVADEIPDVPVTFNARDIPADSVLRLIARFAQDQYAGVAYLREGDRVTLRVLPVDLQPLMDVIPNPPDPRLQQRVTLNLENVLLDRALDRVMGRQPVTMELAGDIPPMRLNLKLENVSTFEALLRVVEAAKRQAPELRFTRQRGVYRLEARPRPAPNPEPLAQLRNRTVSAIFDELPFRTAVGMLFSGSGLQYTIDPNVPNLPVSIKLKEVSLESALYSLVLALQDRAPGLELRQSGDIFILERRGPRAAE